MADKRIPSYEDYEEKKWGIDSSRIKYAPWLVVHCARTESYFANTESIGSLTGTNTVSLSNTYDANILAYSLLLHFNETSATYIDSSPANRTSTPYNICSHTYTVTTTGTLFLSAGVLNTNANASGTNTGGLTSYGDWRTIGSGDFTIEGWYYDRNYGGGGSGYNTQFFNIGTEDSSTDTQKILFQICTTNLPDSNKMRFYFSLDGSLTSVFAASMTAWRRGLNSWTYWCIERWGDNLTIFLHSLTYTTISVLGRSLVSSATGAMNVHIGFLNAGISPLNPGNTICQAYQDEIRITPYARYNGNISIPASEFSDTDW